MAMQSQETLENKEGQPEVDPWELAFAALDKEAQEPAEADAGATSDSGAPESTDTEEAGTDESSANVDVPANTAAPQTGDGIEVQDNAGGSDNLGGGTAPQDAGTPMDVLGVTSEEVESYRQTVVDAVEDRTIREVAEAYIKKGARHTNGKLGATIEDEDICKRDADGVPHFYNPDTGKEFTGDNPRRQAQEWVDDYNKALAANFNATCADYSKQLMEQEAPAIAVLEFAPKYDELDPVRKAMFDNIVEDYEIKDKDGEVIGYSCDLNKALEAVNRQVRSIQAMRKNEGESSQPLDTTSAGTGPALDMKASAGGSADNKPPKFNSIAEAMEYQQDQLLAQMKKGN